MTSVFVILIHFPNDFHTFSIYNTLCRLDMALYVYSTKKNEGKWSRTGEENWEDK